MAESTKYRKNSLAAAIISFVNQLPDFMLRMREEGPYQLFDEVIDALNVIETTREYLEKALNRHQDPLIREPLRLARKELNEGIKPFLTELEMQVLDEKWMEDDYIPRHELWMEFERRRKPWLQPSNLAREKGPDRSWIPDDILKTILDGENI